MVRNQEVDYQPREGMRHTLSVSTAFMRNPAGEPLATVCVVNDITERKRAEEEREKLVVRLQSANQKLQTMDKMKSDFVSVVSHELRTPLTTIKAFAELIIMKPDMPGPRKTKFMNAINSEADRLGRLTTDLLDLARIETGSLKWRADHLSVAEVIRDAIISMGPLFENKGLLLTTSVGSPLSTISGDRDRLVQVVTNLLSNAVKFTPSGGTIHIAARQEPNPPERIVVEISDTGIGISTEDIELIFEKFQRSSDLLTSAVEGTGLGLAISRQIVDHHGGRIWASSTRGKGSVFTFTLPLGGREQ